MNKYFLLVCLFGLVACKGVPAKPDSKELKPVIRETTYPIKKLPSPKQPIRKVKKTSVKNIPYIYGRILYFWKTPQEDQKIRRDISERISSFWKKPQNSQRTRPVLYKIIKPTYSSYFGSLLQELLKRNPENDAKAFLAKKQRFLLGELSNGGIRVRTARGLAANLFRGIDPDAIRKCRHPPAKKLQGNSRVHQACTNRGNSICHQYISAMKEYRFRWNRVMLKDCEKH